MIVLGTHMESFEFDEGTMEPEKGHNSIVICSDCSGMLKFLLKF